MSFVDDLRKINPEDEMAKARAKLLKMRVKQCINAVREGCELRQKQGLHTLSGEVSYDTDSEAYGYSCIQEQGTFMPYEMTFMEQMKAGVEAGLRDLGFDRYRVEIRKGYWEMQKAVSSLISDFTGRSYKTIKRPGYGIYVYVEW